MDSSGILHFPRPLLSAAKRAREAPGSVLSLWTISSHRACVVSRYRIRVISGASEPPEPAPVDDCRESIVADNSRQRVGETVLIWLPSWIFGRSANVLQTSCTPNARAEARGARSVHKC